MDDAAHTVIQIRIFGIEQKMRLEPVAKLGHFTKRAHGCCRDGFSRVADFMDRFGQREGTTGDDGQGEFVSFNAQSTLHIGQ